MMGNQSDNNGNKLTIRINRKHDHQGDRNHHSRTTVMRQEKFVFKMISVALLLVLVFSLFSVAAFAQDTNRNAQIDEQIVIQADSQSACDANPQTHKSIKS